MNKALVVFILFLLALQSSLRAQESDQSTLSQEADSLYQAFEEEESLAAYEKLLEIDADHYKSLWRSSFLYSRIGNRLDGKKNQREYYEKAKKLAEQALDVDSTDTQSHFVMSVAMGRMALISGAKERVAASRSIKKHADRALHFDSTNAGAWHVLGRWHFKVANLSFVERLAANTLFGGIPGDASNEKAAESIERAIEFNDKYVLYFHDLAMVYDEMGKGEQAIASCKTAIEKINLTPDDPGLKEDCRNWVEDWQ